ncbi:MAG: hypothetical protein QF759_07000 [Alphaproteobacteria bacterium]|nr:hypothetical protein [Alphaproteobacteria bacterium]
MKRGAPLVSLAHMAFTAGPRRKGALDLNPRLRRLALLGKRAIPISRRKAGDRRILASSILRLAG